MEALEYLRQKKRLCSAQMKSPGGCRKCPMWYGKTGCGELQDEVPGKAVQIVEEWAEAHPVEGGVRLTATERRFAQIYIEKGYLWAARDKAGELNLYKREPRRGGDVFINTSPVVNGSRTVMGMAFSGITWETSPMCLPKLLDREGQR